MTTMENSPELNWRANLYSSWGPAQPCAVRSERSVVLVEQQCGHGILYLPSSEGLLYPNPPPDGKLARNLTEPRT
jgi:hypothetical protein